MWSFSSATKKTNLFRPRAFFGFGKTLDSAAGNWVKLEERRDFTLTMEYDGIRNVSFFLNGKLNRKVALKNGGTLAPSVYPPVIGDRYSGTHYRFDGLIREGKTLIHTVHDKNSIGKILLLLPEKTGKIHLEMPFCAEKGETIRIKVSLSSSSGKKIKSLHPIALEIRDAAGKQTGDPTSGALVNGVYTQKLTIPLNAAKGTWKILARDPTSGKNLQKTLLIR